MSWEVDFQARPFHLAVKKDGQRRPVRYSPFAMPESLYRSSVRSALRRLAEENARLRRSPTRRASFLTAALAEVLVRWSRTKWPDR